MADYIKRSDALSDEPCAGISCQDCPFCSDNIFGGCKMSNFINSIPTADVAPRCPHYIRNVHDRGDDSLCEKWKCEVKEVQPVRHGRWIKKHNDFQWWKECSGCGLQSFTTPPGLTNFRYCPNCGAKMQGDDNE